VDREGLTSPWTHPARPRSRHLSYREIGEQLGIDPSTADDAVERAAQMIPTEGAAEMRQAMLDAMDRMSRHLWGVVERQQSDDGPGLQAIAQLLRVQERKAQLVGLDAPARRAVDVITHDVFMEAIGDLEADIARKEAELARYESDGSWPRHGLVTTLRA
jgi:hypothetical protein